MTEAVIVSTARTPIGKAFRGAFNKTHGAVMTGHVIKHAVNRAVVDSEEIEDVIIGCGYPEGATGKNIARLAAYRAGLPVTTSGTTVNRFCSSGLQAITMAAQRVVMDKVPVIVAGGVKSVSLVQPNLNRTYFEEDWLMEHKPELWMAMIDTADLVAELDEIAGPRNRSAFAEAAIRKALKRERFRIAGEQHFGSLNLDDYPHWRTSEDVVEWVRMMRAEVTDSGDDIP